MKNLFKVLVVIFGACFTLLLGGAHNLVYTPLPPPPAHTCQLLNFLSPLPPPSSSPPPHPPHPPTTSLSPHPNFAGDKDGSGLQQLKTPWYRRPLRGRGGGELHEHFIPTSSCPALPPFPPSNYHLTLLTSSLGQAATVKFLENVNKWRAARELKQVLKILPSSSVNLDNTHSISFFVFLCCPVFSLPLYILFANPSAFPAVTEFCSEIFDGTKVQC